MQRDFNDCAGKICDSGDITSCFCVVLSKRCGWLVIIIIIKQKRPSRILLEGEKVTRV